MSREFVKETWKEVFLVPQGQRVLIMAENDTGGMEYQDLTAEGWATICMVHVEIQYSDGHQEDDIAAYTADATGYRSLEYDYKLAEDKRDEK